MLEPVSGGLIAGVILLIAALFRRNSRLKDSVRKAKVKEEVTNAEKEMDRAVPDHYHIDRVLRGEADNSDADGGSDGS